ncbi:MAG: hypothetical protein Q8N36_01355 [bacterium]|nr:hypothetical protein [bacterium]
MQTNWSITIALSVVIFLIFLVFREFWCWYFKLNQISSHLGSIDKKLGQMLKESKTIENKKE